VLGKDDWIPAFAGTGGVNAVELLFASRGCFGLAALGVLRPIELSFVLL